MGTMKAPRVKTKQKDSHRNYSLLESNLISNTGISIMEQMNHNLESSGSGNIEKKGRINSAKNKKSTIGINDNETMKTCQ